VPVPAPPLRGDGVRILDARLNALRDDVAQTGSYPSECESCSRVGALKGANLGIVS